MPHEVISLFDVMFFLLKQIVWEENTTSEDKS